MSLVPKIKGAPVVIKLTTANFWQELEQLVGNRKMPASLADCLKELVSSHIRSTIPPEATPYLIRLAKEHLEEGILLSDSSSDRLYDMMVFVPDPDKTKILRSFFRLIPKWPGGELKYLRHL